MDWKLDIKGLTSPLYALSYIGKTPHTLNYPEDKRDFAKGYRGFHTNRLDLCIGCANCQDVCMNEAIDMVKVEKENNPKNSSGCEPRIDYGRCCWCGLCTDVCPPESLKLEEDCIYVSDDPNSFLYTPKNK